ncbi:MAG: mycothiol synthase [Acidimicrobiales bacterium]|nr:mycothiol synthase [Acidimicrobiales bacterium]
MTATAGPDRAEPLSPSVHAARHGELAVPYPNTALTWSRRADVTEIEIVTDDVETVHAERVAAVLAGVDTIGATPAVHGSAVHLAAESPADQNHLLAATVAEELGLTRTRELYELRRELPVPADHPMRASAPPIRTRGFRPGLDDAAWIRVNNRSFATHPDQGAETPETLSARTSEPWFDPHGFLLLDDEQREGELAGFCWTKAHPPAGHDPALGEIYVIGVDPTHHGHHLGTALVLAGLDHLAAHGLTVANLYVESDNTPALRLYDHLGFTIHRHRLVYAP